MRVTLLGKAKGHRKASRSNCRPGEVWGLNYSYLDHPMDVIFDMHEVDFNKTEYINYINKTHTPLVSVRRYNRIPSSIAFPLIAAPIQYFNSSFDYMIFYACLHGATELQLFGFKIVKGGSHAYARPSAEFWLGYAVSRGIRITIHPPSDLLRRQPGGRDVNENYGYGVELPAD